MKRRRSTLNNVSADVVEYLVTRRSLSQNEIAEMLRVDKSFISRVRNGEREFSPNQLSRIADALGIPLGAMLIDARPPSKPATGETKQLVDLCERLLRNADGMVAAMRAAKRS